MAKQVPLVDPRLHQAEGAALFSGHELVVKGALQVAGGVHLYTGVPAGAAGGVFNALKAMTPLFESHGVIARTAASEALAVSMASGMQMARGRSLVALNTTGMQRAAEALSVANISAIRPPRTDAEQPGGAVFVIGEDVAATASQTVADARFLAEHIQLPIIEPSDSQEIVDWIDLAYQIGSAGQVFVAMLIDSIHLAGGGSASCKPNQFPVVNKDRKALLRFERDVESALNHAVLLPPRTAERQQGMADRLARASRTATKLGLNRVIHGPHRGESVPLGIVASGAAYASLATALTEMGLFGRIPVLKLGMTWPIDDVLVGEFASQCDTLIVIEERRPFVERQIRQILDTSREADEPAKRVFGKQFPDGLPGIPETNAINPSIIIERLVPIIRNHSTLPVELTNGRLTDELNLIASTGDVQVTIADRDPTFCAGCPHRDSSSVLLEIQKDFLNHEYMNRQHRHKPTELLFHGDAGCISLLGFAPNTSLMHSYNGMGYSGGAGSGVGSFVNNKQVAFMGDGTFFSTGQQAIRQAISSGDDITFIILDNHTSAMSGQHRNPADERDLMGNPAVAQQVERTIQAMLTRKMQREMRLVRINPQDRTRYRRLLEQTILAPGVKVVIADKECAITRVRPGDSMSETTDQGKPLVRQQFMNIATDVCDMCNECTSRTGCPGLTLTETQRGRKVQTDLGSCVNDGACQRLDSCPSFEQVTVLRSSRVETRLLQSDLPDPPAPIHADREIWRCVLAGIGGEGVNKLTQILAAAGQSMGYDVCFVTHNGIAVRTGTVVGQAVFTRQSNHRYAHALTPYGKADVILGLDLLETARLFDPKLPYRSGSSAWTHAVVNDYATPTTEQLIGHEAYRPAQLKQRIESLFAEDKRFVGDISELCRLHLGSARYANIALLGVAFQRGLLPLTLEALETAIWSIIERDASMNLKALALGRTVVAVPERISVPQRVEPQTPMQIVREKARLLRLHGRHSQSMSDKNKVKLAQQYRRLVAHFYQQVSEIEVRDPLLQTIGVAVYDCIMWGGLDYARKYVDLVLSVYEKDTFEQKLALTRAAARSLTHTMLVKDEVYVASLLTSPAKYEADLRRFRVNLRAGDRLQYRHYLRPQIEVFGKRITWDARPREWLLRLVARCGAIRWMVPGYHKREFRFRAWFEKIVKRLDWQAENGTRDYRRWVSILSSPQQVTGFRDLRYQRMANARRLAEDWLATDPQLFEADNAEADQSEMKDKPQDEGKTVRLPVMAEQSF